MVFNNINKKNTYIKIVVHLPLLGLSLDNNMFRVRSLLPFTFFWRGFDSPPLARDEQRARRARAPSSRVLSSRAWDRTPTRARGAERPVTTETPGRRRRTGRVPCFEAFINHLLFHWSRSFFRPHATSCLETGPRDRVSVTLRCRNVSFYFLLVDGCERTQERLAAV